MKISISYPPLKSDKGTPLLTQNRQFQWFNTPTYIFPVIPAYAASLLKSKGYEVFWDDAIAQKLTYDQWLERVKKEKPDTIVLETKTPVIEKHWKIIDEVKTMSKLSPFSKGGKRGFSSELQENKNPPNLPSKREETEWDPKIVLMGDHVVAFPKESLKRSKVDFVLASGDYDFMLLNLANHLNGKEELEGGWWFRNENNEVVNSGSSDLSKHNLNDLPLINRQLTCWKDYAYDNGNFKYTPGAYLMSGRDCWWGKCTFCSWTTMFPGKHFRTISTTKALEEVDNLIKLGVKEVMEDSGTLPIGEWLEEFCIGMIDRGYNKKITISCNMRINAIKKPETWQLMKKAGFRLILFGLESSSQKTLDKIDKNLKVEEIEPGLKMCKEAGLEPHITAMVGYPWETKEDAQRTIDLAKKLFKKGYVDTLQATVIIPYPGTPLYKYCKDKDLLCFEDYSRFDQREQVMKSELSSEDVRNFSRELYKSFMTPVFFWRKIKSIRSWADIKFYAMAGWKVIGHLADFGEKQKEP